MGKRLAERRWKNGLVCGPLSFDLATDPESVTVKGMPDVPHAAEVAGRADVLVCPGIDAANILYKTFMAMSKYGQASLAGITLGLPVPYIILSRADTLETRLLSIALCSIYAQRTAMQRKKEEARQSEGLAAVSSHEEDGDAYSILVVNPGSTSLKLAIYRNAALLDEREMSRVTVTGGAAPEDEASRDRGRIRGSEALKEEARRITEIAAAYLRQRGSRVNAIAARGGFVPRPKGKLARGVYRVAEVVDGKVLLDEELVSSVVEHPERVHASNLGIPVAAALAERLGVPAFFVDPVVVDEFDPEAEISGYEPVKRISTSHALSIHAAARRAAEQSGRPLEDVNLVVAHLGGGITIAAVRGGSMVDCNIALLGEGPFTPQRAGTLPLGSVIDLCYSGNFSREELEEELSSRGGVLSYLGEHRMEIIEERIRKGDQKARLVIDAMIYRIAREIGSMYTALECDVEAIVLTGGLTRSSPVREGIRRRVVRLAPVIVYEGSLEMEALASEVCRVLTGDEESRPYPKG
jgi:butyrate kinase